MSLTNTALKNISATGKPFEQADRDGLSVRVSPTGKTTFQYRYRFLGMPRRMKIGSYPETKLKEARERLRAARELLDDGIDPIDHERTERLKRKEALTVEGLCRKWVNDYAAPNRKRWQDLDHMLKKDVYPRVGGVLLDKITRRMIVEVVLEPVVKRGAPVQANKLLTLLKQIFNYGVELGYMDANPSMIISKRNVGGREVARTRVLNDFEIRSVWEGVAKTDISKYVKLAIKILLVTGQRRGEITKAQWEHIDFDNNIWTIPAENSKNGKTHTVHISPLARSLFLELKKLSRGNSWVMPAITREDKPMDEHVISRAVCRHIEEIGVDKWVPHDLRRTAATKMSELGVAPHVVEKILNHSMVGVMAIYNRYDYWDECSGLLKLDTQLSGNLPLERSVHYEEKAHV
jgi:integrase